MKKLIQYIIILTAMLFCMPIHAQVNWSVPDTNGTQGDTLIIPVRLDDDVTGMNVLSFEAELQMYNYDLIPIEVITTNTLAGDLGAVASNIYAISSSWYVEVSAAGIMPLIGNGVLFYIKVVGLSSGAISFVGTNQMNEGSPAVITDNGSVSLAAPLTITVSPNTGLLLLGEQLQFNVSGGTAPYTYEVSDTTLASIDTNGLLTGLSHGILQVRGEDSTGLTDWTSDIEIRAFDIEVSDTSGNSLDTILVPIRVSELSGLGVVSGQFELSYSSSILEFIDIEKSTTLLEGASVTYSSTINSVDVAFASVDTLVGNSTLIYLRFVIKYQTNSSSTSLSFTSALFNQDLVARTNSGSVNYTGFPVLSISPSSNQSLYVGETIQFTTSNGIPPYVYQVFPPSRGTIDSTGLFTALESGTCFVRVEDAAANFDDSGIIEVNDGNLIVDSRCAQVGDTVMLPVYLSELSDGISVNSFELTISFREPELIYMAYEKLNTMAEDWLVLSTILPNGDIRIVAAGTMSEVGDQVVIYLKFITTGDLTAGEFAYVNLVDHLLNEGSPNAVGVNGGIRQSDYIITSVVAGMQSACDTADNTYNQELTFYFDTMPASGNLIVNDSIFALVSNPQTIVLLNRPADGNSHHVTARFSAVPSCDFAFYNAYLAIGPCVIITNYIYVDSSATGLNNGVSWLHAYTDLQDALLEAATEEHTEVWVAGGTYYPDAAMNRNASYNIPSGVSVFGGFAGNEINFSERNTSILANRSILSGDLGQDDLVSNNSYHIIVFDHVDSTTLIDGFTLLDGNADGPGEKSYGGGAYNDGEGGGSSNPQLINVEFIDNYADNGGGALYNNGTFGGVANPSILGCSFVNNHTNNIGGAISNDGNLGNSSPLILHCYFGTNSATWGGAIYNSGFNGISNSVIVNNKFYDNVAMNDAGSIFSNGRNGGQSNPLILGNVITNSYANRGGALFNDGISGQCIPLIIHNSIANTSAASSGQHIHNQYSDMILGNSILWGVGTPITSDIGSIDSIFHCIIQGGAIGDTVIDQVPLFIDEMGNDLRLQACSPGINMGQVVNLDQDSLDIISNDRPYQATLPDMGAFEYHGDGFGIAGDRLFVVEGGTGTQEGSSWQNALATIQEAINATTCNPYIDTIWVAAGTYFPDTSSGRSSSVLLRNNVVIFGGFHGDETLFAERDLSSDTSIISGDIGGFGDDTDNSYHVIRANDTVSFSALNGLIIQDGNANGPLAADKYGGGLLNYGGLTLDAVRFRDNKATSEGTAIYSSGVSADLYLYNSLIDNAAPLPGIVLSVGIGSELYILNSLIDN